MNQVISEQIEVAGVYRQRSFQPSKFKWRATTYSVQEITLISEVKDGGIKQRLYSVMSGGNLYRLKFDRTAESWSLEEVWCE